MRVSTLTIEVEGHTALQAVVMHLCRSDCWFEVMPLGDDIFAITVKADRYDVLPTNVPRRKSTRELL